MIQAVIFDLDGTLVDSNELHVTSWERAFRHFGKRFSLDALRRQIGKGSDQYLPEFLDAEEMRRLGKKIDEYRSESPLPSSPLSHSKVARRIAPFYCEINAKQLFELDQLWRADYSSAFHRGLKIVGTRK